MQIRQIAVNYDPAADRLLLRVRTGDDAVFAAWLTRRLALRLWPHWVASVQQVGAAQALGAGTGPGPAAPRATATPDGARMLADAARAQHLQQADFSQPFATEGARQPLGAEPLLPHTVQLTPRPAGRLHLLLRDGAQRTLQLELDAALADATHALLQAALRQAEWGLDPDDAPSAPAAGEGPAPRLLN